MNPLAPLDTSFAFRASASSSGDLAPFAAAEESAVAGLSNKTAANSLYESAQLPSVSYRSKRAFKSYLVGIMIPIFSIAFANSSGSTVPLLLRSKYLNDFLSIASSDVAPDDFYYNLFFNSLSKLAFNPSIIAKCSI